MSPRIVWEYMTCSVETKGFFFGRGVLDHEAIKGALHEYGRDGWELVSCVPVSDGNIGTARLLFVLKRPAE